MMRLDLRGIDKRRLGRLLAVMVLALAAGQLVQTVAARQSVPPEPVAVPQIADVPTQVVQLAGNRADAPVPDPAPAPGPSPVVAALTEAPRFIAAPVPATNPCPVTLDLMVEPGAVLGVTLVAPCHASERVVLRHAGLAFTATTTATGSLFLSLPALESSAALSVKFGDGSTADAAVQVPDLAGMRRFGVQWQGDDTFQVIGVEAGVLVAAAAPAATPVAVPVFVPGAVPQPTTARGAVTRLGDATVNLPLLAEIYTFPATGPADVVIEAAVTARTCGREMLGETLASVNGVATVTELTLAMPDCDALGSFLVLNNLAADLTLATVD